MKKNKKAFTLIELLVTIAIISTLSSIAIVSFSGQTA
ncbi:pilin, partial [Candidatus Berkelbacteria bacterium CG03_land_8_20_14_0_80_40_36]